MSTDTQTGTEGQHAVVLMALPAHTAAAKAQWEMEARAGRTEWGRAVPQYLDGHTVVGHGDAGVAVPAHVHGGVGTVVALPVQGATRGVNVIFGLLFYRDLIRGSWGRRIG